MSLSCAILQYQWGYEEFWKIFSYYLESCVSTQLFSYHFVGFDKYGSTMYVHVAEKRQRPSVLFVLNFFVLKSLPLSVMLIFV